MSGAPLIERHGDGVRNAVGDIVASTQVENLDVAGQWHAMSRANLRDELFSQVLDITNQLNQPQPSVRQCLEWIRRWSRPVMQAEPAGRSTPIRPESVPPRCRSRWKTFRPDRVSSSLCRFFRVQDSPHRSRRCRARNRSHCGSVACRSPVR